MIYLLSIKKYLITLLKSLSFFILIILFYFFTMVTLYHIGGVSRFWVKALLQSLGLLQASLPFMLIISTCFFFAFQMTFDRVYAFKVLPLISTINALFLLIFFLTSAPIRLIGHKAALRGTVPITQGYIYPLRGQSILITRIKNNRIKGGLLFDRNSKLITGGYVGKNTLSVKIGAYFSSRGPVKIRQSFSFPLKRKDALQNDTGISRGLFDYYIRFIGGLKKIFTETFQRKNTVFSLLAIILMSLGFFSLIGSLSFFFNEKQAYFLSFSGLLIIALLGLFAFPSYLGMVAVIGFGIHKGPMQLLLPGIIVTIFALLLSVGMVFLKEALAQKKEGVA